MVRRGTEWVATCALRPPHPLRSPPARRRYSGWFLPFKPGGFYPNGTYHVKQCDDNYDPPLCSDLYHDQAGARGGPEAGRRWRRAMELG